MTLGIYLFPQVPGAASVSLACAHMGMPSRQSPASKGHVACPLVLKGITGTGKGGAVWSRKQNGHG